MEQFSGRGMLVTSAASGIGVGRTQHPGQEGAGVTVLGLDPAQDTTK